MKLTLEEKLECVKLHLNEGIPIYEVCRTKGIDPARLKYYVGLYDKWGETAFKIDKQRRLYSRELKLKTIYKVLRENVSFRQASIELMLSDPGIVSDWVKMYKKYGEEGIKDTNAREAYKHHDDKLLEKEYKKLVEDNRRKDIEIEYLKKSYSLILKRSKRPKKK